jgi:hypothetical protein
MTEICHSAMERLVHAMHFALPAAMRNSEFGCELCRSEKILDELGVGVIADGRPS